jgi:hypothetical protein
MWINIVLMLVLRIGIGIKVEIRTRIRIGINTDRKKSNFIGPPFHVTLPDHPWVLDLDFERSRKK